MHEKETILDKTKKMHEIKNEYWNKLIQEQNEHLAKIKLSRENLRKKPYFSDEKAIYYDECPYCLAKLKEGEFKLENCPFCGSSLTSKE
jgi:hypothetical protein